MSARRCKACLYGVTRAHLCLDENAASRTAAAGGEGSPSGSLALPRHPSSGGGASASTQPAVRPPDRTSDGPHRSTFDDGGDAA